MKNSRLRLGSTRFPMLTTRTAACACLGLLAGSAGLARAQARYDFFLVDSFNSNPLAGETRLSGINDSGVACGVTTVDNVIGYPGIVWGESTGKVRVPVSNPSDVNNNGLVVGIGAIYDLTTHQSFSPPNLPGTYYSPSFGGVNDAGVAVGSISITSGSDSAGILRIPYIWDAVNGARTIAVPNAKRLYRINNAGVALGWMNDLVTQGPFFVDITTGAYTALTDVLPPDFGVGYPAANDINDSGEIAGSRPGTYPVYRYGFVYSPATGVHVLPFPGDGYQQSVSPNGINNAGTVVGDLSTTLASPRIFVYSAAEGLRDLGTPDLVAGMPAGYRFYTALRINDQGWIVGYGHTAAGKITGFVLKARPRDCPADFNGDGGVDGSDVEAFFVAWESGDNAADVRGDGGVDGSDVEFFFTRWEAGGC